MEKNKNQFFIEAIAQKGDGFFLVLSGPINPKMVLGKN